MAYKMQIPESWIKQRPKLAATGHFYNMDAAVGPGCPNRRSDVMLVQLLLNVWFDLRLAVNSKVTSFVTAFDRSARSKKHSTLPYPPINGVWGNKTLGWIFWCQMIFFPMESAINGKINPIRPALSSLNDPTHTLLLLNGRIRTNFPKVYENLGSAPGVPLALAQDLKNGRP